MADLNCAARLQDLWYWLDVKVKDQTVVTVEAGRTPTDGNAGVAYCDGVINQARDLGKTTILINTQTSLITGTLLTIDMGSVCR